MFTKENLNGLHYSDKYQTTTVCTPSNFISPQQQNSLSTKVTVVGVMLIMP